VANKARCDQAGAGAGGRQLAGIFRIFQKANVGGAGGIERRNVTDQAVGRIARAELGAGQGSDRAGREFALRYDKILHDPACRRRRLKERDQNFVPPPKAKNWVRS
jgi:hypothetical protein